MVDTSFATRLDLALEAHGLDRTAFAKALGKDGSQKLTNWIARGRIGQPSYALVRRILPRVGMDWLNDGAGSEPDRGADAPTPSQPVGMDLAKLTAAIEWVRDASAKWGPFTADKEAELVRGIYAALIQPETLNLLEVAEWIGQRAGGKDVGQEQVGGANEDGHRGHRRKTS